MEYSDDIHGTISIPEDINSIIQSPHFQRLKQIQQLGLTYKTLPKANSNRYKHCIGTYYLAAKTLDAIEKNTKDLIIPDFYKKVVTIAALLHDIGHGPFSHAWEMVCCGDYHHEENAFACIDEIFKICLTNWEVDRCYAIKLIKALIVGDRKCLQDHKYAFLFDIVNNKQCGIDVDKWDYLLRDHFYTSDIKIPEVNLDFKDVFLKSRASDDRSRIEYRYCDYQKIYNIFNARYIFHVHIYRRPINVCMEKILEYIISTSGNTLKRLNGLKLTDIRSQHVDAFLQLTDDEIWKALEELKNPEQAQLVNCLKNPNLIEECPDEEKESVENHMTAEIEIENPGEVLKSENIIFYGNPSDKPTFELQKGFHKSVFYFKKTPIVIKNRCPSK